MSDYIKREDAMTFEISVSAPREDKNVIEQVVKGIMNHIKNVPSADVVEVRHAKDIGYEDSYGWKDVCSLCGCEFRVSKSANYCPNCGARMDGDDNECK